VTWTAACGRQAAVELLAEVGFDVNARHFGRPALIDLLEPVTP
jgi:hypothetical protein